ncbi:ABC transporter ATP-binding protein [Jatrophihabitans cynanchi]|uniref:ABC transporter ATP-binding protein n=1 Tax=Jatrophihabitans cynanchi TaxID=2944128 RepID=A0ABY7K793_9ACTN|nr:ABC transporter ATP-binding protein [Jatrophihabitans sp. SB3-54]WAX59174.1 ABC transporter ATP-binding protein [Jatrophihabitans sp. SB3-54]
MTGTPTDHRTDANTPAAQTARLGSAAAAIEIAALSKIYRNKLVAVDDVTLSIAAGTVFGLLGPNGAGKTTTIKMIAGLITPTTGRIQLGGFDVSRQRSQAVRQIGAVLEGSRNVYWPLSAWQNLLYFGRLKGLRSAGIKPRAQQLLTDLGLWGRRHDPVGSYSRGMQQKVAIAAALITDPPIILLDEPTLGLDVEAARTVRDWITHLAREEGKTIVLTTHQLDIAQQLADRIAVIRSGSVIADLPTRELLARYAEDRVEVRVAGSLNGILLPAGVIAEPEHGATRIIVPSTRTSDVYAVLRRLEAGNIAIVSMTQAQPSLEEIFLRLIGDRA